MKTKIIFICMLIFIVGCNFDASKNMKCSYDCLNVGWQHGEYIGSDLCHCFNKTLITDKPICVNNTIYINNTEYIEVDKEIINTTFTLRLTRELKYCEYRLNLYNTTTPDDVEALNRSLTICSDKLIDIEDIIVRYETKW